MGNFMKLFWLLGKNYTILVLNFFGGEFEIFQYFFQKKKKSGDKF